MTVIESLRYWFGYRLFRWLAAKCAAVALHYEPHDRPPPRPPLNLTPPDGEEDRPQQMEMRWV